MDYSNLSKEKQEKLIEQDYKSDIINTILELNQYPRYVRNYLGWRFNEELGFHNKDFFDNQLNKYNTLSDSEKATNKLKFAKTLLNIESEEQLNNLKIEIKKLELGF